MKLCYCPGSFVWFPVRTPPDGKQSGEAWNHPHQSGPEPAAESQASEHVDRGVETRKHNDPLEVDDEYIVEPSVEKNYGTKCVAKTPATSGIKHTTHVMQRKSIIFVTFLSDWLTA